jgi:aminoglycoside/choline kinase family phosphotransferase
VPEVLEVDGGRGIVLLEDLGDRTLQQALDQGVRAERRRELYRVALDQLVRLQREAERGPHTGSCFRVAFDVEKLSWELHYFEKHFVEGLRGCKLSVEDRAGLAQSFHHLAEEMASWPRVLCHRDFHSRNLMLSGGRVVWLDFQDARLGPATYDLVSLLRDAYVDLPGELVEELVEEFRQRAVAGEARDAFRLRFELTTLQRTLKALGTFGYMATVRENPVYLQYVARTLAAARVELQRHRELDGLRRVLARHIEELS